MLMDTQRLKSLKILIIGDSCLDKYYFGTCDRISPEAPVPILKCTSVEERAGMSLNVEKNFSNLGIQTTLITNTEPIIKERYIDKKTKRHMLRVDIGEEKRLSPATMKLLKGVNLDSYDAVVISDYDKGFITHKFIKALLKRLPTKPVYVDSKKRDLSCYEGCIIKINDVESHELKKLPNEYDLIVTRGKDGAVWESKTFPAEKVEVFDACGAGDTFLSALTVAGLMNKNLSFAIRFANKCAGIAVQKFGTYQLTIGDINGICY